MSTPPFGLIWRTAGIQSVGFFLIAYFIYGDLPKVGSSPDTLVSFYDGNRMRILIATFILGFAILNLLWFAAAIRNVLSEAGQDGWGAAVTASSAVVGGVFFVLISVGAALAYKIAGSGNPTFTSGLNDTAWACFVFSSFPRAMLIMSPTFGLWRAGIMSNGLFTIGVVAVVLGLLGSTTWATSGIWAPDGAYSRFILPIISLAWIVVISGLILKSPSAASSMDKGW
jgi:hypothetical protein